MAIVNVQFADSTMTVVVACFAVPQPSSVENQQQIQSSDQRYTQFYDAQSVTARQGMIAPD